MADEIRIDEIVDRAGISADKDFLVKTANEIFSAYSKLHDTLKKVGSGNISNKDLSAAVRELNAAQKQLDASTKALLSAKKQMSDVDLKAQKLATEATKTLREQERLEQEQIKTKKAKATETERTAKAQEREAAQIEKALNDYALLSKAYIDARDKARNLFLAYGEGHPLTVQAVKDASDLDAILKKVDASVGIHSRNVGNYKSGYDALGNSFNQIARELPNLSQGFDLFLRAVSNNFGQVQDAITGAKKEIAALQAAGQPTEGLFTRIGKSLFSFNTLLNVGITVLVAYGSKIFDWVASLFKGEDALASIANQLKATNKEFDEGRKKIQDLSDEMDYLAKKRKIDIELQYINDPALAALRNLRSDVSDTFDKASQLSNFLLQTQEAYQNAEFETLRAIEADKNFKGKSVADALGLGDDELKELDKNTQKAIKLFSQLKDSRDKATTEENKLRQETSLGQEQIKLEEAKRQKEISDAAAEAAKKRRGDAKRYAEEDRKAQFELNKLRLQDEIDLQKAIAEAGLGNMSNTARQKQLDAEKALIDEERKFELAAKGLTVKEKELIREQSNRKIIAAEVQFFADLLGMRRSYNESVQADADRFISEEEQRKQKNIDDLLGRSEAEIGRARRRADELQKINNEEFNNGEKSKEEHERKKLDIENNFLRRSLESQISYYKNLIYLYETDEDLKTESLNKIADLEKQLSAIGTTKKDNKEKIDGVKALQQAYVDLGEELKTTVFAFMDYAAERRLNAIRDEMDLIEQRKNKEIEAVNQSLISQTDKAAAIAVINARAAAQEAQLEKQRRAIEIQKAKFDKQRAAAEVIQQTAIGVIAAQKLLPPFSTIVSALTIAIGAAQLARIIAQPIPAYKYGKKKSDSYKGLALWGEERQEVKVDKSGNVELSPKGPSYTYTEPGDTIFKSIEDYQRSFRTNATDRVANTPFKKVNESAAIVAGINKGIKQMEDKIVYAINTQPQPVIKTVDKVREWVRDSSSIKRLNG